MRLLGGKQKIYSNYVFIQLQWIIYNGKEIYNREEN